MARFRLAAALVVAASSVVSVNGSAIDAIAPVSTLPPPSPGSASRCPDSDFDDGTMRVGGVRRTYAVVAPSDPRRERTLLINLHGTGGSIATQLSKTRLDDLGVARGWVVVTPQALGAPARWNIGEDPALPKDSLFIKRLMDGAIEAYCLGDDVRILLAGGSNGGFMAGFTACRMKRVDGVAMVIGTAPVICAERHRIPMLTIRGTADTTVPYTTAMPFTLTWVEHASCDPEPGTSRQWPGVTRTRWFDCREGATVAIDTVQGGVHAWPGAGLRPLTNSEAGLTYPASERIVQFLDHHVSR